MQYDQDLITTKTITRDDGKEYVVQVIPTGMSGGNVTLPYTKSYDDEEESEYNGRETIINKNDMKEYTDYINEGIDPDSDEVREIKLRIEKDHSQQLLDEYVEEECG